jgi:hypothetical protein
MSNIKVDPKGKAEVISKSSLKEEEFLNNLKSIKEENYDINRRK